MEFAKKYLPEPNPRKLELPRDSCLEGVFEKAQHLYFSEFDVEIREMSLADSGGVLLPVEDKKNWILSSFYKKKNLQPSLHCGYWPQSKKIVTLHLKIYKNITIN